MGTIGTVVGTSLATSSLVRHTNEMVSVPAKTPKSIMDKFRSMKLAVAAAAPFTAYGMVQSGKTLASSASKRDKVDAALLMVGSVGDLGDMACTFAEGLRAVGAVAESAVAWTTPVMGVSAVVSSVAAGVHIHGWARGRKFMNLMNDVMDKKKGVKTVYTHEQLGKLKDYLNTRSDRAIKRFFGVRADQLMNRLDRIFKETNTKIFPKKTSKVSEKDKKETLDPVDKTVKALKGRVQSKIRSHRLGLLSTIISLIATAILLFTPLAPLGFALYAVCTVLSIATMIHDRVAANRFKKAMCL